MTREYCYNILEIPYNSSREVIKHAYRKMTLKYHPDRNQSSDAQTKFIQVSKAYEYLNSDKVDYDWYLEELKKQHQRQNTADAAYKARVEEIMREKKRQSEVDNREAEEKMKLMFLLFTTITFLIFSIWNIFIRKKG